MDSVLTRLEINSFTMVFICYFMEYPGNTTTVASNKPMQFIREPCNVILPRKASTRQLTPLIALKKIWGSCLRHGCWMTSWGTLFPPNNCSWNFGVELTMTGLLRSTGLLKERDRQVIMIRMDSVDWDSKQMKSARLQTWACVEIDTTSETHSRCPSQRGWGWRLPLAL